MSNPEVCPKCGGKLIDYTVKFDNGNYYTIIFCENPQCPFVIPVKAEGEIPFEIKQKYFPTHEEVRRRM